MPSIFTKIIQGEIPCEKILESDKYFAFLDIRPINPGHCLVIPKQETDYIFDLDDDILSGLLPFAKKIIPALEKAVPCKRVGIMVAGLEVPHAHVHLVPMFGEGDLTFSRAKPAIPEELSELRKQIVAAL